MSVTNFEAHTIDLTPEEKRLADDLCKAFEKNLDLQPIKSAVLEYKINYYLHDMGEDYRLTSIKLRKWVNFFRSTGALPILADSQGYSITYNHAEIADNVKSLRERANSINNAADGLERFLPHGYMEQQLVEEIRTSR